MKIAVIASAFLVHAWQLIAHTEFPDYATKQLPGQYRCVYEAVSNGERMAIWLTQPCPPILGIEI